MRHTTQQILKEARETLSSLIATCPVHATALRAITFRVSGRMTAAAGMVKISTSVISLSRPYFEDPTNFQDSLKNTILHEIAHVLAPPTRAYGSRKRDVHGNAWKAAHIALGGTGETYHTMELAVGHTRRVRKARTSVTCGCGCGSSMSLGPTQLKKHQSGRANYMLKGHTRSRYIF